VKKMQTLLEEFSQYLRLSFDFKNAHPVVPLAHELSLIKSYVYIEKQRFGDRLQVEWDIAPDINIYIPPLSIQPLVENAIKHGLLRQSHGGMVRIKIREVNDDYNISVIDNGVGIDEDTVDTLLIKKSKTDSSKRTSVGLQNINRRLYQLYHEQLTIESKLQIGTTVSFRIPAHLAHKNIT